MIAQFRGLLRLAQLVEQLEVGATQQVAEQVFGIDAIGRRHDAGQARWLVGLARGDRILTTLEDQRGALAAIEGEHLADEDEVVAAVVNEERSTLEARGTPCSSGAGEIPSSSARPANLSSPREAKRFDSGSCSRANTCTFQCWDSLKVGRLKADLARLHSTMGGDMETELKLLAVMPTGASSLPRAVMMVTPVVKVPKALRKARVSKLVWLMGDS